MPIQVEFWIWHSLDGPAAKGVANAKSTPLLPPCSPAFWASRPARVIVRGRSGQFKETVQEIRIPHFRCLNTYIRRERWISRAEPTIRTRFRVAWCGSGNGENFRRINVTASHNRDTSALISAGYGGWGKGVDGRGQS